MTASKLNVIALIAVIAANSASLLKAVSPTPDEMAESQRWAKLLDKLPQTENAGPLFSFTYDGKPSTELLGGWKKEQASRKLDDSRTERTLMWSDPATGLEVRCVSVVYADFPVVEWTVYLKNSGKADTPILENILGMDVSFHREGEGVYTLRTTTGDNCSPTSYQPILENIGKGATRRFAPAGGRPTNGAYPYFNIDWSGQGAIAAIGWPGQWAAQFDCDPSLTLRLRGGQELTKLKLLPGEEIRTPLSVLLLWKGDVVRAQNLWRRWMIAHNIPRVKGKLPPPFTSCMGTTGLKLLPVADKEIADIDAYRKAGLKHDYWWIDAGWYPCNGAWWNTGTWEPDPVRLPKGLKQVSDHAHQNGMKFVLWFEPERNTPNTWLAKNHPEWTFGGANGGLFNEGNSEARNWLIDYFDRFIKEQGVDLYREDFNIDPLGYWRGADAPDRQGITENLYVQGHLAYWDELLKRNPEIMIDSCASGGRRNDLETLRRAVPLLRSDYQSAGVGRTPESFTGNQGHTYGLSSWVPYSGTGVYCDNDYEARSHFTPALGMVTGPSGDPSNILPQLKKAMDDWKAVAEEFYGDYYPLTSYSLSEEVWMAWQFDRPEAGSGMVQAFRHNASLYETFRAKLHGLEKDAVYTITNLDVPGTIEMSGRELAEKGLLIEIKEPHGSSLITYKKKP